MIEEDGGGGLTFNLTKHKSRLSIKGVCSLLLWLFWQGKATSVEDGCYSIGEDKKQPCMVFLVTFLVTIGLEPRLGASPKEEARCFCLRQPWLELKKLMVAEREQNPTMALDSRKVD